MELDKLAPPASPCVHYSRFHLCPSLSRSTISFNSTPLNFLPLVPRSPPTRCLVKMTECEDLMEYFLSSLWISLLTDLHVHTQLQTYTHCVYMNTIGLMHHVKVSWISERWCHWSWLIINGGTATRREEDQPGCFMRQEHLWGAEWKM